MHLFRRVALALLTTLALAAPLAACSSQPADDADPPVWGPTYAGQVYCGYWYSAAECIGRPGIPMAFPHTPPMVQSGLAWALWTDYVTYHGYYWSPRRYQVLVVHHVVVPGGRSVFTSTGRTFNTRYASYEKTYRRTTTTTHTVTRHANGAVSHTTSQRHTSSVTVRSRH